MAAPIRALCCLVLLSCAPDAPAPPDPGTPDAGRVPPDPSTADARCDAVQRGMFYPPPVPLEPCEPGFFRWVDYKSEDRDAPLGDGQCHRLCCNASECVEPGMSKCLQIGLWENGDWSCNGKVRMCMPEGEDQCVLKWP